MMIHTASRTLIQGMEISGLLKSGIIRKGGYHYSIVSDKVSRFVYNFFEFMAAGMTFGAACCIRSQTTILAHTWQKIVLASILMTPVVTRGIAYFYSKKERDSADCLDLYAGQLINLANLIASTALLIIMRSTLPIRTTALSAAILCLNMGATYYLQCK